MGHHAFVNNKGAIALAVVEKALGELRILDSDTGRTHALRNHAKHEASPSPASASRPASTSASGSGSSNSAAAAGASGGGPLKADGTPDMGTASTGDRPSPNPRLR